MANTISVIGNENNYKLSGNIYWKEKEGFLLSMFQTEEKITINIDTGLSEKLMPAAVGQVVAEISEQNNINDCIILGKMIQVTFIEDQLTSMEVGYICDKLIHSLNTHSVAKITRCELCKQDLDTMDTTIIKINNKIMKSHKSCYTKLLDDIDHAKESEGGNYLSGVVGAIIFGFIGAFPWILAGILGWFASILGMVIGLSANFGYNLFKGKQGKFKSVILIGTIVIMVVVAGFITQTYDLVTYLNGEGYVDVPIMEALKFIVTMLQEDSEFLGSFAINTIMGIGFGLLGSWRVIKSQSQLPDHRRVKVELVE